MNEPLRKSGISCLGDISWGTHFCVLHASDEEQLEILVPYFAAGLTANERCIWITTNGLDPDAAAEALGKNVPALKNYLASGQMSIVSSSNMENAKNQPPQELFLDWKNQVDTARTSGYDGLRVTNSCAGMDHRDWRNFLLDHKELLSELNRVHIITACVYSIEHYGALAVFDLTSNYHLALVNRHGLWEALVNYRIGDVELQLQRERDKLKTVLDAMDDGVYQASREYDIEYLNSRVEDMFGPYTGQKCYAYFHDRDVPCPWCKNNEVFQGIPVRWEYFHERSGRLFELFDTPITNEKGRISKLEFIRDITLQRDTETSLRKNMDLLSLILETLPVGIWIIDQSGKITSGNPAVREIWGGARLVNKLEQYEEYKGWWHDTGKRVESLDWAAARAITHGERCFNEVIDIEGFGGCRKVILNSAVPVLSPAGEIMGAVVVNADITELKRIESALQRERDKLRSVLDGMTDGVIIISRSFEIEFANLKIIENFGLVEGQKSYEYFGGPRQNCPWCRNRDLFPEKALNWVWKSPQGTTFEVFDMPLVNADGTTSMLEILHDVTRQRKAEELLSILSHAIEQSPMGVILTDLQGAIQYMNPRYTTLTGYSLADVAGKTPNILKSGYTDTQEYEKLWGEINGGKIWQGEFLNKRKSGELYWESASISPIRDDTGTITNFVAIKEDITARKQAELEVENSRRQLSELAEHLQNVREEERTSLSLKIHDNIGQRLAVLRLDAAWLGTRLAANVRLHGRAREIVTAIDDLISEVQQVAADLRPGVLDKLGLCAAIEWQAHNYCDKAGIRCSILKLSVTPDIDPELATTLFRIFQEILTNAVRHAMATELTVALTQTRAKLNLKVSDNGCGISPQEIDDSKSLGLIGIRERAEIWGGTVQFVGSPGQGTTVTLSIPLHRKVKI